MKRLSRKLELQNQTRTEDGAGGFVTAWSTLGTHWAAVEPGRGRLETGEGYVRTKASYSITIRSVPPLSVARPKAGQRFLEGDRVYLIRAVAEAADARHLTCYADEEAAA